MKTKRASGTMLILVVAFMLILIVFCMATLAMVTVANNRAVTKFEENQSYYTAASALEVFASGSLKDETYYAVDSGGSPRKYIKPDGTDLPKLTQGRALELDLYKLSVLRESGVTPEKPMGDGAEGTDEIFGTSNPLNLIINMTSASAFSTNATFGNQFTSNPSYKYAEYAVELPNVSSTSPSLVLESDHNFGLFADKKPDGSHAKIKVEVIERYYDMAGVEQADIKKYMEGLLDSDASTPTSDEISAVSAILTPTNAPDATLIEAAILGGERHKDYFRIRVTAETELLGVKGVTAREFTVQDAPGDDFDSANISSGGLGNGDKNITMNITGGATTMENLNLFVPGQIGSYYSEKDIFFGQSGEILLGPRDHLFAKGHIIFGNAGGTAVATNGNAAYIYAGQGIYAAGAVAIGNGAGALNTPISVITAGPFDYTSSVVINGDLIADALRIYNQGATADTSLSVSGSIYVNDYHTMPDNSITIYTDQASGNPISFTSEYPSVVPGYAANVQSTADGFIHVNDRIYLGYKADESDPNLGGDNNNVTRHYITIGLSPIKCNSDTEVWSNDGTILYGTVDQLYMGTHSDYEFAPSSKALLTGNIDYANGVPAVKVDYWADSLESVLGKGDKIQKRFELPKALYMEPTNDLFMPTTQSKFSPLMYSSFFTADGDLIDTATGASAWDSSVVWYNEYDSNMPDPPGVYGSKNGNYKFGVNVAGLIPGATQSHFGGGVGAYPASAITAAHKTAEADYLIENEDFSEIDAASDTAFYAAHFNLYSSYATRTANGQASYTYTGTNGSETIAPYTMPAGDLISSSGLVNGAADPYGSNTVYIDATTDEIELQFDGNVYGTYIIKGDKKVNLLIPGSGDVQLGYGSTGYVDVRIYREKVYAMLHSTVAGTSNPCTFRIGEGSSVKEASVGDTHIYVSSDVDIDYGGGNSIIASVIVAHMSEFEVFVTQGCRPSPYVDYKGIGRNTSDFCTMGSIFSNNYKKGGVGGSSTGKAGNLFLKTDVPPEDGKPNFNWSTLRYLSGNN
ncbi:MAG: hypothetical protein LBM41_04635 [Ruminococcus sp.]|jgi:hypothetical protein|nr:hypothetical protein [Ruminococcus sp.]